MDKEQINEAIDAVESINETLQEHKQKEKDMEKEQLYFQRITSSSKRWNAKLL